MLKNSLYSFIFIAASFVFSSCNTDKKSTSTNDTAIVVLPNSGVDASKTVSSLGITKIEFTESVYDFGKIDEGQKVEHVFTFKNIGENPLVIQDARASCGCTVPEYTKDTIAPGAEGKLNVIYDSNNKEGKIDKSVTVTANTDPTTTELRITAFVIKKIDGPFKKE